MREELEQWLADRFDSVKTLEGSARTRGGNTVYPPEAYDAVRRMVGMGFTDQVIDGYRRGESNSTLDRMLWEPLRSRDPDSVGFNRRFQQQVRSALLREQAPDGRTDFGGWVADVERSLRQVYPSSVLDSESKRLIADAEERSPMLNRLRRAG